LQESDQAACWQH